MANVHVHLSVRDLAASRDFYRAFLGAAPVKEKPDYVKFLPTQAPLNLAMKAGVGGHHPGHFGLQFETPEAVAAELARVRAAGLEPRVERDVDC